MYSDLQEEFEERPDLAIELADTLEGNEVNKAPNVKAVNDALGGKLDARVNPDRNTTYLYGNSWQGTYGLFKTSPHGVAPDIVCYGVPETTGKSKPRGTIGVNMPEQPYQATPKQYVDEAVEGRVPVATVAWQLYGTGNVDPVTKKAETKMMPTSSVGTGAYAATYAAVNNAAFDIYDGKENATIGICDPIKPNQAVNLRTLEREIAPVKKEIAFLKEISAGILYDIK